jgi:ferric-dicitrate binding protein FerR (iron transport regulator)
MNARQREDVDWLAFRYVAAELSPAESRQFECRLEHDQEAREAVGRLVETTCAVRMLDWDAASRAMPVRRRRPWYRRRAVQVAAGLAVALMVALLVRIPRSGQQRREPEGSFATAPPAAELAVVWSNARTELNARQVDEALGWRWLDPADGETHVAGSTMPGSPVEGIAPETPDWMVWAVVAMEAENESSQVPDSNVEGI